MYWKFNKRSFAAMSTELMISIALATLALFFTLGIFSDNLGKMITSGNFQKFFLGKDKTTYSAFKRDYSDSEIETLMTGEQGLTQIRKAANNIALDIINKEISGTDTSQQAANSVDYLALAIKSIVGEPHICTVMKKESDKKCNEDSDIAGYKYAIDLSANTATAVSLKNPTEYTSPLQRVQLGTFDGDLASLASTIKLDSNGKSKMSKDEKYDLLKKATKKAKGKVYDYALLLKLNDLFKSSDYDVKKALKDLTNSLEESVSDAHSNCTTSKISLPWPFNKKTITIHHDHYPNQSSRCCTSRGDVSGQCWVGPYELKALEAKSDEFKELLNNSNEDDATLINRFINFITTSYDYETMDIYNLLGTPSTSPLRTIDNDHSQTPTSCKKLKDGLSEIIKNSRVDGIAIPTCNPSSQ